MYSPPPGTLIIFAHSPAGFGHLRVTLALQEGLEKQGAQLSAMLGTEDSLISSIHRATSVTRFGLALQEWFQHGFQQKVMTYCFRSLLQINARSVINDMETIVLARPEKPKHIQVKRLPLILAPIKSL
jgi:UDP-N-acetylglucosamine:LPS N-acetylglucosamine transferase